MNPEASQIVHQNEALRGWKLVFPNQAPQGLDWGQDLLLPLWTSCSNLLRFLWRLQ